MTADVELLPCPFCGGKIEGNVSEGSTFRWRKVDGCCADGPEVRHNTTAPDQGIAEHESRIAAIKAWNTRAATAAKDAEIEALRALAGCAYQMAGFHDAPVVWLDRLSQAANGDPLLDPDTLSDELLPYQPDVAAQIEALRAEVAEWKRVAAAQAELHDEAEARAEQLAEALRDVMPFVVTDVLEHCDGNKCREQWCAGCSGDAEAAEAVARSAKAAGVAYALLREQEAGRG